MHRRAFLALAGATLLPLPVRAVQAELGLFVHAQPRPLPPLDIRDGDARPAMIETFRGRPLLMNLWASWCTPCVAELPALDRLKPRAEAEGVAVVALCLDRSGAVGAVNTYARLGITSLAVHVDGGRSASQALAVPVLPTTLLIDGGSREVARYVGTAAWDSPQALALLRSLKTGDPLNAAMAPPSGRASTRL